MKDLIKLRSWYYFIQCKPEFYSKQMQQLLQHPEVAMQDNYLKIDRNKIDTTTVAIADVDDRRIVIKCYNIKNFWHGLKRAVSRSRAKKCWQSANLLLSLDIATPLPIAIRENRIGLFRREAYYFYEYVEGELAEKLFKQEPFPKQELITPAKNYIKLIKTLFKNKITHGDLKATNFIITKDKVYCVDLDSAKRHLVRAGFNHARRKDINRFFENWQKHPAAKQMFSRLFASIDE